MYFESSELHTTNHNNVTLQFAMSMMRALRTGRSFGVPVKSVCLVSFTEELWKRNMEIRLVSGFPCKTIVLTTKEMVEGGEEGGRAASASAGPSIISCFICPCSLNRGPRMSGETDIKQVSRWLTLSWVMESQQTQRLVLQVSPRGKWPCYYETIHKMTNLQNLTFKY